MVVFSFFVRGQLANSTGITQNVNRFHAISLALMMPTGFPAEIRAKPQKSFSRQAGPRENFTHWREFHAPVKKLFTKNGLRFKVQGSGLKNSEPEIPNAEP
jgi:hypothetical protein